MKEWIEKIGAIHWRYKELKQRIKRKLQSVYDVLRRQKTLSVPIKDSGTLAAKSMVFEVKSTQERLCSLLDHVFKIFNDTCPHYLKFDFTRVSSLHKYNTRGSSFNFVVPLAKGQATVCPRKKLSKFWRHIAQKVTGIWQYPFAE